MRVVAGEARGRKLQAPAGTGTRPTSDRVREALFNALVSLDAVHGATVLDLFAGSGALGIEALSRGAAACTFVEHDRAARAVVEANLTATKLNDRATVRGEDAERFVRSAAERGATFDLALLDPPYAYDRWTELLEVLPAELAVIESDREVALPERWQVARQKKYGTTLVAIARARSRGPGASLSERDGPAGPAGG